MAGLHRARGRSAGSGAGTSRVRVPRRAAPHVCQRHGAKPPPQLTSSPCIIRLFSSVCCINSPLLTPALRRWGRGYSRSSNYPRLSRTTQLFGHIPGLRYQPRDRPRLCGAPSPSPRRRSAPACRALVTEHRTAGPAASTAPVPPRYPASRAPVPLRYPTQPPVPASPAPVLPRYPGEPPIPTSPAPVPPRYPTQPPSRPAQRRYRLGSPGVPPIVASPAPVPCRAPGHQPRPPRPAQPVPRRVPGPPPRHPPGPAAVYVPGTATPAPRSARSAWTWFLRTLQKASPPPPSPALPLSPPPPPKKKVLVQNCKTLASPGWLLFCLLPIWAKYAGQELLTNKWWNSQKKWRQRKTLEEDWCVAGFGLFPIRAF